VTVYNVTKAYLRFSINQYEEKLGNNGAVDSYIDEIYISM
jgi:hypothetical protein